VDIEDFYDSDPRRRAVDEITFGLDWSDGEDAEHLGDLFWSSATGELYLMRKPHPRGLMGWDMYERRDVLRDVEDIGHHILGAAAHLLHPRQLRAKTGQAPRHARKDALTQELTVEVVAVVPDEAAARALLDGWEAEVDKPDSLGWLRARLAEHPAYAPPAAG